MTEIEFNEKARETLQLLSKGVFLTTAAEDKVNTMSIGWGYLGWAWKKPIFGVMVRHSRFTHELLEKNAQFTVTVPTVDMSKEMAFCGTKSGRDTDKIKACGFELLPGKTVSVPVLNCKGYQYECRVLCKTEMTEGCMPEEAEKLWYGPQTGGDLHTFYFGEITACYLI